MILEHPNHMDAMVTFEVNLAEIIFVQEIVCHHQPLVVVGKGNRVRARVQSQVDNSCLERMFRGLLTSSIPT